MTKITGSWCSECGPDVMVDEDGVCATCGGSCTGDGAELALKLRRKVATLQARAITRIECKVVDAALAWRDSGDWAWRDSGDLAVGKNFDSFLCALEDLAIHRLSIIKGKKR